MSRLMDRAMRMTLALVVAGGLGIGARSAAAGTALPECSNIIPYQSCPNNAACTAACDDYFGPGSTGICDRGCCTCRFY